MTRPVENVNEWRAIVGKMVRRGMLLVGAIQVDDAHRYADRVRQRYDVYMIALSVHGLHFLFDVESTIDFVESA